MATDGCWVSFGHDNFLTIVACNTQLQSASSIHALKSPSSETAEACLWFHECATDGKIG